MIFSDIFFVLFNCGGGRLKRKIELLAPAKNLDCGLAAINHGADAVYIGAPKFGARKMAGNSLDDLARLIEHAHFFNAKVYVAFNTLLFNDELAEAENMIRQIDDIGADAIIVQDMGILEMQRPPIPLHASTQTDNRTVQKVAFLQNVGFDQVVLARELSFEQIKEIRAHTKVKLECFVHGALCVSYSGQCYMSQAINGRSANRGECGQPCRLPYSLSNAQGKTLRSHQHLMSLKDLNLSRYVGDLIDAGVDSLKIEGRLKDVDYVKNITAHYRRVIDVALASRPHVERASLGYSIPGFVPNPEKSFSRGFSSYFFNGRGEVIWNVDSPKSLGERIGRIARVDKDSFVMDTKSLSLNNGDGLCFFSKAKELVGVRANRVDGTRVFPASMKEVYAGAIIFRNHDQLFEKTLSASDQVRRINAVMSFSHLADGKFQLMITDDSGLCSSKDAVLDWQPARSAQADEAIRNQLAKTGGTPLVVNEVLLDLPEAIFIPAKELNALRRDLVNEHLQARLNAYVRERVVIEPNSVPYLSSTLDASANILNDKARQFYMRHGVAAAEWGVELQNSKVQKVMTSRHCLLDMLDMCLKKHPDNKMQMPLTLFNDKDAYRVETNCKDCVMTLTKIER
ncbi:MAG: U32 family peptidase [Marinilabiliaceae bacterium]|nr:U32 family peptidase [Marinilabiliaceae bacterium]